MPKQSCGWFFRAASFIVLATHSPPLPTPLEDTDPFRLFRDFCEDPKYFMDVGLEA